jgi:hypothetical protein
MPWDRCGRFFAFEDSCGENIQQREVPDEAEEETIYWCLWKEVEELEREIVETIKGPAQTVEDESVPDVNNR